MFFKKCIQMPRGDPGYSLRPLGWLLPSRSKQQRHDAQISLRVAPTQRSFHSVGKTVFAPGMSVEAPGPLVRDSAPLPRLFEAHLLLLSDDVVYCAAKYIGTDRTPQEMLQSFTTAMVRRGTLEYQKPITLQGWPGREVQNTIPKDLNHRFRVFIVEQKMVHIEVVWKPGHPVPATTDRFLDSLMLPPNESP